MEETDTLKYQMTFQTTQVAPSNTQTKATDGQRPTLGVFSLIFIPTKFLSTCTYTYTYIDPKFLSTYTYTCTYIDTKFLSTYTYTYTDIDPKFLSTYTYTDRHRPKVLVNIYLHRQT